MIFEYPELPNKFLQVLNRGWPYIKGIFEAPSANGFLLTGPKDRVALSIAVSRWTKE
jgi:hypothetical protein